MTAERRAAAARLVRDGVAVSCARDLPVRPSPENPVPALHHMLVAGDESASLGGTGLEATMDFIGTTFHGMATTHVDAFCHVFVQGKMWNGRDASEVRSTGARRNSILALAEGIVGRGVLLDIPRLRGVDWIEIRDRVAPEELAAAAAAEKVGVDEGTLLLVSTGRDARRAKLGPWEPNVEGLAGLRPDCVDWLFERRIAVLGSDGVSDGLPALRNGAWPLPIHQCCLVGMGVPLLDNLDLSRLAAACAARARWEFLLAMAPLRIAGGTGSPVNPIALF